MVTQINSTESALRSIECLLAHPEVGAWTVNDQDTMRRLLGIGVARIYTDHPRLLLTLKK